VQAEATRDNVLKLVPTDESAARSYGVSLGAGVLLPLAADGCWLAEAAAIAQFLAAARGGSAVRAGLRAAVDALAAVVDLRALLADIPRLEAILGEVAGRGVCDHPDRRDPHIGSVMTAFAADLRAHLLGSGCRHLGDASFFPAPAEG